MLAATLHADPCWLRLPGYSHAGIEFMSVEHILPSCLPSAAGLQSSHKKPELWTSLPVLSIGPPCSSSGSLILRHYSAVGQLCSVQSKAT